MAKKLGYSPVNIFAAACGALATVAARSNPAIAVSAATAAGIGTAVDGIIGGIELTEAEANIKGKLDQAMDEAWDKINKEYRLDLYSDDCLSELKQEIMGGSTSVEEFTHNLEYKGLEPSLAIVVQSILKKHRKILNNDPEYIWDDSFIDKSANNIALILVAAMKSIFENMCLSP